MLFQLSRKFSSWHKSEHEIYSYWYLQIFTSLLGNIEQRFCRYFLLFLASLPSLLRINVLFLRNDTVPAFNSCTICMASTGIIHDRTPYYHPVSWARMRQLTSQLNVALIRKLRGSLVCLAYFFDMLSMDVCTTRHWQTSGRLVQELNVCTVYALNEKGNVHHSLRYHSVFLFMLYCETL